MDAHRFNHPKPGTQVPGQGISITLIESTQPIDMAPRCRVLNPPSANIIWSFTLMTSPSTCKTALITGASSGIGKALAYQFAKDGYHLVLAARGVARMQAVADDLQKQFNVVVTVIGADLETHDGAAQLHAEVKARGIVLSALVNNAGYGAYGEFKDSALAPELTMMQLNMTTVVVKCSAIFSAARVPFEVIPKLEPALFVVPKNATSTSVQLSFILAITA
jgi:uncharacterized protein YbjT (DUF2867 family)